MQFAKAHAVLETRQLEFLDGALGRLELTFDSSTLRSRMPDLDLTISGKRRHLVGAEESFTYRVLGRDADTVAILIANYHGRDRILHLHFVGDDAFWLYSEDTDFGLRDLNFREYFSRTK